MAWALDRDWCAVVVDGKRRRLSEQNFELLRVLVDASGRFVGTKQLAEVIGVTGASAKYTRGAVAAHVRSLRRVIGKDAVVCINAFGYAVHPEYQNACVTCGRPWEEDSA